jgi:hypothetical protein
VAGKEERRIRVIAAALLRPNDQRGNRVAVKVIVKDCRQLLRGFGLDMLYSRRRNAVDQQYGGVTQLPAVINFRPDSMDSDCFTWR